MKKIIFRDLVWLLAAFILFFGSFGFLCFKHPMLMKMPTNLSDMFVGLVMGSSIIAFSALSVSVRESD